ncbi:MAG: NifU family protein [Ilumatobacteraceae bacterium]
MTPVGHDDMSNGPVDTATGPTPVITGDGPEHDRRVRDLLELMDVVRPAVEADGGNLRLVSADTDAGVVRVELAGACGSCAVAAMTLEGGITRILRQRLDWVTEVQGGVEEDPEATGFGGWTPKI